MLVLPMPLISSLVLAFWLVRVWLAGNRKTLLLAAVAMAAVQGVIIALVQHYGISELRWLQPIGAMLVPPAFWLAFDVQAGGARGIRFWFPHLLGPLAAAMALVIAPALLDLLTPLSFTVYGLALLRATQVDGRVLPDAPLEYGDLPRFLWRVIALSLLASALSDVLLALDYAMNAGRNYGVILSLFSSLTLLTLGLCGLSDVLAKSELTGQVAANSVATSMPEGAESSDHAEIFTLVDATMRTEKFYLDPDLTLNKMARKLGLPAKTISTAVNRTKGDNISRYVNSYRIAHAQKLLSEGASVTQAMLESGFNTKSNFNREFNRIASVPPSSWRER